MTRNSTRTDAPTSTGSLDVLLQKVQGVPLNERMHHRNEVAAFGAAALDAVSPWLQDPRMAAFAIRVIGKIGDHDADRAVALERLRACRPRLDPNHQSDVDEVLARWGERATPARIRPVSAGPKIDLTGPAPFEPELRARLVAAAREHRLVSYSEAGEPLGLTMRNPSHRPYIGRLLKAISDHEIERGRPMLSSIVVKKGENWAGEGFLLLGQETGRVQPGEDARGYARREMDDTFAYWSTHEDPEPADDTTAGPTTSGTDDAATPVAAEATAAG